MVEEQNLQVVLQRDYNIMYTGIGKYNKANAPKSSIVFENSWTTINADE